MSFIASVTDDSVDLSSFIPVIKVIGVGGAGGNAIANIMSLEGVHCAVANTDAQSLVLSPCKNRIQLGRTLTAGLGAGALPEIGKKAAMESKDDIVSFLTGTNMLFLTAGMGGGTGTGATPVIAQIAREMGILTVAVVTKPFNFEGHHRIELAEQGVHDLSKHVDTIIVVANQKLFRISNENTTFTEAFKMADDVLYGGVKCITDLITMPGLINLDFADVRTIMSNMGYAMMGASEASGENRATTAIEMAITNPLLENVTLEGAKGILVNITGGPDMTLFEVNDVVAKIQERIDRGTRLIFGAIFDQNMEGKISVSVVATGVVSSEDRKDAATKKIEFNQVQHTQPAYNEKTTQNVQHNKPPYMKNKSQVSQATQQSTQVFNDDAIDRKLNSAIVSSDYYAEDDIEEFDHVGDYQKNTTSFDRSEPDFENDMIDLVGGNEFLLQRPAMPSRQKIAEMEKNREIKYDWSFDSHSQPMQQNNKIVNKVPEPTVTLSPSEKPQYYEEEEVLQEDTVAIPKKPSGLFARMASMIKEKKIEDAKTEEKKKLNNDTIDNNKHFSTMKSDLFEDIPVSSLSYGTFFNITEEKNENKAG